jgi:hypothetical protein
MSGNPHCASSRYENVHSRYENVHSRYENVPSRYENVPSRYENVPSRCEKKFLEKILTIFMNCVTKKCKSTFPS